MDEQDQPRVVVVMGSDSDWPAMQACVEVLREFGVCCEARVLSAHRTPERVGDYATGAGKRGVQVIIAAAGGAAHLAGVLAAHSVLPVIGVPMKGGVLDGLDSLLSTVQMPSGVPVATVAAGNAGPKNAALLAVQILALGDTALREQFSRYKADLAKKVETADAKIRKEMEKGQ